jgi:gliding motility-associated-like protein
MTIFVNSNRLVRIPNVFTPNGDGLNDSFTAYNVKAGVGIDQLKIFDRWGEMIYLAKNIPLGDISKGWDGTFKGQKVNPGVYVYLILVKFLDGEVLPFSGDITVLR